MNCQSTGRNIVAHERSLIDQAHQYLPGGSLGNIYRDVIIRQGSAGRILDVSGNEYVDYLLGSGPMLIGHAHPEVGEAVRRQLDLGTTFFATNERAVELAERIVDAVPCADQVRFMSSGTEATAYAIRTVRAYRNRSKILKFEGGYHGMHDYALMSVSPIQPHDYPRPVPDSAGIPSAVADQVLIAPFNDIAKTVEIIEQHLNELAGVIVEPMQRTVVPQPGFLEGLRQVTERHDLPLIFDELVTGFRLAYGGAQEYYDVIPDLCTLGKVVGGGFPLAAVAGRLELMAHFDPAAAKRAGFLPQIGTLNGNPVAAAAGLATLDILKRPGTYEYLFATGRQVFDALVRSLENNGIVAQVVGEPPVFDIYFTDAPIFDYRSTLTGDSQSVQRFNQLLLAKGIFKGDTKFYISTAHSREDIDFTINAFHDTLSQLSREATDHSSCA